MSLNLVNLGITAPNRDNDKNGDERTYNDFWTNRIAGIPIMFFAGWWVADWWHRSLGTRGAFLVWLAYAVIDLAILLIAGFSLGVGILFVVSIGTKLAAVYLGATTRLK